MLCFDGISATQVMSYTPSIHTNILDERVRIKFVFGDVAFHGRSAFVSLQTVVCSSSVKPLYNVSFFYSFVKI